jgi:hypothetical protein
VLTLSQNVPPVVLIGSEGAALQAQIAATSGVWFHGDPEHVLINGDLVTGWRATDGGAVAGLSAPNAGESHYDLDRAGFVFQSGVHCGFTLPNAVAKIDRFTAAIVYSVADLEARSLFALNTGAANAMIFLSESEGRLFAKDRAGAIEVSLPAPPRNSQKQLVIMSFGQGRLSLWMGGEMVMAAGRPEGLDVAADLFIGCRSNRPGLTKTLGASVIHDVMFWPDRALLGSTDAQDIAVLGAMHRYRRWTL